MAKMKACGMYACVPFTSHRCLADPSSGLCCSLERALVDIHFDCCTLSQYCKFSQWHVDCFHISSLTESIAILETSRPDATTESPPEIVVL